MFFEFQNFKIHYTSFGNGPIALLAFHGFGQDASVWNAFESALKDTFTVYAFDHFYHGKSQTPSNFRALTPINPEVYTQIFEAFIHSKNIQQFWLMGYSLGGKSIFHLTQHLKTAPKGIIALAPDGIIESGFYGFVSRNKLGEFLYTKIMFKGKIFDRFIEFLFKSKLLNESLYKFVKINVGNKRKRTQVLYSWKSFASIRKANAATYERMRNAGIKCLVITGKYDQVLDAKIGKLIKNKIDATHVEWDAGHDLIKLKLAPLLKIEIDKLML